MPWQDAWPSHQMVESRRKLVELAELLETHDFGDDTSARSALSKFVIIRACGHLEFTFTEAFCEFTQSQSSPMVANYVREDFKWGINPNRDRLVGRISRLDKNFSSIFEDFLDQEGTTRSEDLSSLVSLRNLIAHGRNESSATSQALKLTQFSLELSDWLIGTFAPIK